MGDEQAHAARPAMHGQDPKKYASLSRLFLAALVLWIVTGTEEIQFPLIYVLPVGVAAWRSQRYPAYALAMTLPVLRIGLEFPWGTDASLVIADINEMETAARDALAVTTLEEVQQITETVLNDDLTH